MTQLLSTDGKRNDDFLRYLLPKKTAMQIRTMDAIFRDNLKIYRCDKIAASFRLFLRLSMF